MKPTKDVWMAVVRLRKSAEFLVCIPPGKYGGQIEADILAVLEALEKAIPLAADGQERR